MTDRQTFARRLCAPVDGASASFIRAGLGLTLAGLFAAAPFLPRVMTNLSSAGVRFPELGFAWLRLPQGPGFYRVLLPLMALCALGLAFSRRPRIFAGILATLLGYGMLADTTFYSSTYYLVVLYCGLFAAIPNLSGPEAPRFGAAIPRWGLYLLRVQLAFVYGFAAIAKLDTDWLAGRPLASWLSVPIPWLPDPIETGLRAAWVAPTLAWGGLLLDGLIVPLLLWRPTRAPAFVALLLFHSFNGLVLHVFPLPILAAVLSTVFFDPSWPRRLLARVGVPTAETPAPATERILGPSARTLICVFVIVQLLLPLRHVVLPGDVAWNEAGSCYAWRLRARDRRGALSLWRVDAATGRRLPGSVWARLTPHRRELVKRSPHDLAAFARHLAAEAAAEGRSIEVYANALVSLNQRPYAPFIAEGVNLAATPQAWSTPTWVLPSPRE